MVSKMQFIQLLTATKSDTDTLTAAKSHKKRYYHCHIIQTLNVLLSNITV